MISRRFSMVSAAALCILAGVAALHKAKGADLPNILWITAEDMSANLGCYGDDVATTPNLDRFAAQAIRYTHAFATAPVCSPARSCLITGVYATSLGTQRLRSEFPIPANMKGFPSYLRRAGYFTTNNVKTDYNIRGEQALIRDSWDRNDGDAHWRQREGRQPFFSVFNLMTTHQSRTGVWPLEQFEKEVGSKLSADLRHDPKRVRVPPYYPDTPLVRKTLARYYDCITVMDGQVGQILAGLEADGLAADTIVFFFSDHGMGLPRGKRLLHDTGMRVPFLVRFPEKYRHLAPSGPGSVCHRLLSFVDLPPTVLSLAGLAKADHMQGRAFLGVNDETPRDFVFGARDRVDEAFDLSRSVRDQRFLYIRNYMPHLSWMQPEWYSDQSPMRQQLNRLSRSGRLNSAQMTYAAKQKAIEELYDTQADPEQLTNLATSSAHQVILQRLPRKQRRWSLETRDLGFLTEPDAWRRAASETPWEMARDPRRYPLERILPAAELVGQQQRVVQQKRLLADPDAAVRYWAAVGLHAAGKAADQEALRRALADASTPVQVEAAAALAALGDSEPAVATLTQLLRSDQVETVLHATRALELLGERARPALPALQQVFDKAQSQVPKNEHPCWLFVLFSADAALWGLEPDSSRPRLRF